MIYSGSRIYIEERGDEDKTLLCWSAKVDGKEYGGYVEIVSEEDYPLLEQALMTSAKSFIDELNGLDPMEIAYRRMEELEENDE